MPPNAKGTATAAGIPMLIWLGTPPVGPGFPPIVPPAPPLMLPIPPTMPPIGGGKIGVKIPGSGTQCVCIGVDEDCSKVEGAAGKAAVSVDNGIAIAI